MKSRLFLLLVLNIYIGPFCKAQNTSLLLNIKGKDSVETKTIDSVNYKRTFRNFLQLKKEVDTLQIKLFRLGHLDLILEDLKKTSDSTFQANLILNKRYNKLKLYYDPKIFPESIIQNISLDTNKNSFGIPFEKTEETLQYLTNYLVNTGNTFSNLSLTDIKKKDNKVFSSIQVTKGNYRSIDKITIKGYTKFPKSYLKYYSRLRTKETFSKKDLIKKSNTINSLPFANNSKPPEILFRKDSTQIFLYIEKQPANTFDGFLGFSNDTETNNLELNGYINLHLTNNLNYGEELNITYKSDGNEQQRFNANIRLPYIFKTPLGLEAGLDIFKRDSSFLTTEQHFNLNYLINSKTKVFLGYKTSTSNNLLDTPQPSLNIDDYDSSFIRTGFEYIKREDNNLFPVTSNCNVILEAGSRNTSETTTSQIKGEILLAHIFNLNRRNSIFLKNQAVAIFSDDYFTNELFRFGGINSIRGFEENILNASLYNILNTEYRYLLSSSLFIHSIIDYGYFEDDANELSDNLTSVGFGLGLNTQTGLFRIIFANGKTSNQGFRFANTKVHISLNARF